MSAHLHYIYRWIAMPEVIVRSPGRIPVTNGGLRVSFNVGAVADCDLPDGISCTLGDGDVTIVLDELGDES